MRTTNHTVVRRARVAQAAAAVIVAAAAMLAGCTAAPAPAGVASPQTAAPAPAPAPATTHTPTAGTAGTFTLTQYPADTHAAYDALLSGARHSVSMEMYELSDHTVEQDLAADVARGVTVHVMLDRAYSGRYANQAAYRWLADHRVPVEWATAGVIFHIKGTVVDHTTAVVSTGNLTPRYYPTGLDAAVTTTDPAQVHAVAATFAADWAAHAVTPAVQAPGLVWSPRSQQKLVRLIDSAHASVAFSSEELSDRTVTDALAGDARRGMRCQVLMTYQPKWAAAFHTLEQAGCHVRTFPDTTTGLYVHEKQVVVDDGHAVFLGSENATPTSLDRNRELGVVFTAAQAPQAAAAVQATFTRYYTEAEEDR